MQRTLHLVDEVESAYVQLEEISRADTLTMRDVDRVSDLLPEYSTIKWIRKYHELPPADKVHPFDEFMKLLDKEREAVTRLAKEQQINSLEENVTKIGRCKGSIHQIEDINSTTMRHKYCK